MTRRKHKRYETIIFDFDGTIADTFGLVLEIINKNPSRFGIDGIDPTEVSSFRDRSLLYLLREFNIHLFRIPFYTRIIRKELGKELYRAKVFPGILDVLYDLKKAGFKLGILTSNSKKNVKQFLKDKGMDVFDFVCSEPAFFKKARALKILFRRYKLNPNNTLYIGDEIRDIEASEDAGIDIAAVCWGYNSEEALLKHKPRYLVREVPCLVAVVLLQPYTYIHEGHFT